MKSAVRRVLVLSALMSPTALYERPIPERHRIIFYIGHLEAFDWNLLARYALDRPSFHPSFDRLFAFGIDPIVDHINATPHAEESMLLRGNPPVGTCTICVGKKEIGWQSHFGVVRALDNQTFYRGE